MSSFDPIFAEYPALGFQDIWFLGLEPAETAMMFNFACNTYGKGVACTVGPKETVQVSLNTSELPDADYEFKPLLFNGIQLDGVAIRIEEGKLAIDFNSGIDYWTDERQAALISWLRALHRQAPQAKLIWAHEGCINSPSEDETTLLRLAVAGAA